MQLNIKLKKLWLKVRRVIIIILPFLSIDLIIKLYLNNNNNFYPLFGTVPILFTICWSLFFVAIILSLNKLFSRIVYLLITITSLIMFTVNIVYYFITKTYFDFILFQSYKEGTPYIFDAIKRTNIISYVFIVLIIGLIILGYKSLPDNKNNKYLNISIIFLMFVILHNSIPYLLGKEDKELIWSTWRNPKNIYISFNDNNKSMRISGFYEYTFRNFYMTFLKTEDEITEEELEFLENSYIYRENKNKYSGIYKDKNLILLQLEGIDDWILNETDTPTLYKMRNNSINFNNHYSFYNGGGSTFNSEFAVNTGFITPFSFTKNAYSFNKNNYPNSLANLFKKEGYHINAFHMNSGEYYSRTTNYLNWGYNNYYGLIDLFKYNNNDYKLDRELIINEDFSSLMFQDKFVNYIITYTLHMPFNNTSNNSCCKQLYDLDKQENDNENVEENDIEGNIIMTEEECIRRQAKETDYMVELMLNKLEQDGLIDDVIIVVFTDHYLYTVTDETILSKHKNTTNNLINKTPFFIWSNKQKRVNINTVTSQLNILPTILNLFGFEFSSNDYIGDDALNTKYNDITIFSDYSWYDGNVYIENGEVTNNKKIKKELLEEKDYYVNYITKKNDLTLKYNYFK